MFRPTGIRSLKFTKTKNTIAYCVDGKGLKISGLVLLRGFALLAQIKDKDYCQIEIIKGLTDKGQFQ